MSTHVELDAFDIKILEILQEDASVQQKDVGEKINLSTAAVNRRLKRLKDLAIIESYHAKIKPEALGFQTTIITNIKVINELDRLRKLFSSYPQIQQSYYVTGEWDFVLIILIKNMQEYSSLAESLFMKNKNILKFNTLVCLRKDKVSLAVPF